MQLYSNLAKWWPLLSPKEAYEADGLFVSATLSNGLDRFESLLELGCGSGFLVSHLPRKIEKHLIDSSSQMLEQCARANPGARCQLGDMRELRLGRKFDAVLVHDALMYMPSREELLQCLETAAHHCREGGLVLLLPDVVKEHFLEGNTLLAGQDGEEASVRLMEWHWDPDPEDESFQVEFSLLVREGTAVSSHHESHRMGLFAKAVWEDLIRQVGLVLEPVDVPPGLGIGECFLARKTSP